MTRSVLFEGVLLIFIGLVAFVEGLRLVIFKDPYTLYDPLGPGLYAAVFGMGLVAVAMAYLAVHRRDVIDRRDVVHRRNVVDQRDTADRRERPDGETAPVERSLRRRLAGTIGTCVVYISLISVIGYLPATVCFFIMEFRIERIRSWPQVVLLSLVLSGLYYLVFVRYCGMVFPKGIIR